MAFHLASTDVMHHNPAIVSPAYAPRAQQHSWMGKIWRITCIQNAQRARMCGQGDKDRRVISRTPVVELEVFDEKTKDQIDISEWNDYQLSQFAVMADLYDDTGRVRKELVAGKSTMVVDPNNPHSQWSQPNTLGRHMVGSRATSPVKIYKTFPNDQPPVGEKKAVLFIFTDLSIRTEQTFRIKFSLFVHPTVNEPTLRVNPARLNDDVKLDHLIPDNFTNSQPNLEDKRKAKASNRNEAIHPYIEANMAPVQPSISTIYMAMHAPCLATCFSDIITVYAAKKFKGVETRTELSEALCAQGVKITNRKKETKKNRYKRLGDQDSSDEDDSDEEEDETQLAKVKGKKRKLTDVGNEDEYADQAEDEAELEEYE